VKPRPNVLYRVARAALAGPCALPRGSRVLVACSGGPDSLALLHVLTELAKPRGLTLAVAHLDHGVRGARGAADARFVAREAHTLGLDSVVEQAEKPAKVSEDTLRRARHAFLARAARDLSCDAIALGHTADDQAETVLLRLARGTGLRGLAAMRPRRGRVVRPLLEASRADVLDYLRDRGLKARQDETNRDPAFARNFVRAELVPKFAHLNPQIARVLAGVAGRAAEQLEFVQEQAAQALRACAVRAPKGQIRLVAQKLLAYHRVVREAAFSQVVRRLAGPGTGLTRRHLGALEALVTGGNEGARTALPGGVLVRLDHGRICFETRHAGGT
jgi:tRNA(Ile)-lysidine synthase